MIHLPLLLLGWGRGEEAQTLFFIPGGQIWRPKIYETRKRWRQNAILFLKRASLRQALYLKCFHTIALHILEFYLKQSIIWQTHNHTLFTILDASWSEYWYSVSNHTHLSSHIISFIFYLSPTYQFRTMRWQCNAGHWHCRDRVHRVQYCSILAEISSSARLAAAAQCTAVSS